MNNLYVEILICNQHCELFSKTLVCLWIGLPLPYHWNYTQASVLFLTFPESALRWKWKLFQLARKPYCSHDVADADIFNNLDYCSIECGYALTSSSECNSYLYTFQSYLHYPTQLEFSRIGYVPLMMLSRNLCRCQHQHNCGLSARLVYYSFYMTKVTEYLLIISSN